MNLKFDYIYNLDLELGMRVKRHCYSYFRSEDGDESSEEEDVPVKKGKKKTGRGDVDIGKVVCVEITDKKKSKDNWFPALVVAPNCQETVKIRTRDEYLVRSFRDGR